MQPRVMSAGSLEVFMLSLTRRCIKMLLFKSKRIVKLAFPLKNNSFEQ